MKKSYWIVLVILLIIIGLIVILRPGNGGEDNWIKDSNGVYIKHGNPCSVPNYVLSQQSILNCSIILYKNAKNNSMNFSSQCLGKCDDYSADIVHVPRSAEDDLVENQCSDYRNGLTHHFIELDKNGKVVRVV